MQRDLSSVDVWAESLERSRARRERAAAARRSGLELPAPGLSLAAVLALSGPAAAVAANDSLEAPGDGGGGAGGAGAAIERVAKVSPAPDTERRAAERLAEAAQPAPAPQPAPAEAAEPASAPEPAAQEPAKTASFGASEASTSTATASTANTSTSTANTATSPVAKSSRRRGGGVAALQRALGVTADGDFGPATERALKRWQRRHGLAADGVAGPLTRRALGLGDGPVLKRERPARSRHRKAPARRSGRGGGGVVALQRALGVSADGVFGPGTERALKSWQRRHGLVADGVAGPQTRRALGLGAGPLLKRKRGGGGSVGRSVTVVDRVIAAANAIATKPYRYGGGHGSFTDSGYDCSGSVSYALHGGGLLSSPLDSGGFMSYGLPGPGRHITIYAHSGHVYMTIDGRRFDTSARSETGSRWTSTQRSSSGYTVRHPRGL